MICRKAIVMLPDANFLSPWCQSPSSRAQNRHFCALFASETLIFGLPEHKIEVFVLFCPPEPPFSGISSTKSRFLCAFTLRKPCFRAFRAQNWGFCAREADVRHREVCNFEVLRAWSQIIGIGKRAIMLYVTAKTLAILRT